MFLCKCTRQLHNVNIRAIQVKKWVVFVCSECKDAYDQGILTLTYVCSTCQEKVLVTISEQVLEKEDGSMWHTPCIDEAAGTGEIEPGPFARVYLTR